MTAVVLDSGAVAGLVRHRNAQAPGPVHALLTAALEARSEVAVPAAVLAELYRGGRHDAGVDSLLKRANPPFQIIDTDRTLARRTGQLLAQAGRGSRDHVDATVVAVATVLAAEGAPVLIATGDRADISALAARQSGIAVEEL